jgi:hypothetical protein
MAYKKVGWKDYPDTTTPVNATNLNQMDEGIAAVDQELTTQKENATDMQDTIDQLNTGLSELNLKLELVRSHVGMIVQTTTLDTEAKVIAIYGGTSWSKIEGRFLLGASSSYAANSTGGEAAHRLTINEMPSHNHAFTSGGHAMCIYTNADPANQYSWGYVAGQNTGWYINANKNVADITYNGGNAAHNNMPPYKAVYIWERTA